MPRACRICASTKWPIRHFAMTGIVTDSMIERMSVGSDIRATPPSLRMSAGTRSSAITAQAPASWAIRACSGVTTSMITPPLSIWASPALTLKDPVTARLPLPDPLPSATIRILRRGPAVTGFGKSERCFRQNVPDLADSRVQWRHHVGGSLGQQPGRLDQRVRRRRHGLRHRVWVLAAGGRLRSGGGAVGHVAHSPALLDAPAFARRPVLVGRERLAPVRQELESLQHQRPLAGVLVV